MADAVDKSGARPRREFRNISIPDILSYRNAPAQMVSILHRISGALMFLIGLPLILYLLQTSLRSELSFEHYRAITSGWFVRLVLLGLAWAYLHHLLAGIRHIFLDMDIGTEKPQANTSALVVLGVSGVLTLVAALKIFGVF